MSYYRQYVEIRNTEISYFYYLLLILFINHLSWYTKITGIA